jgi:hypothetical protein
MQRPFGMYEQQKWKPARRDFDGDTLVPTLQRAGAAVSSIRQPPLHVDLTCLDGTAGLTQRPLKSKAGFSLLIPKMGNCLLIYSGPCSSFPAINLRPMIESFLIACLLHKSQVLLSVFHPLTPNQSCCTFMPASGGPRLLSAPVPGATTDSFPFTLGRQASIVCSTALFLLNSTRSVQNLNVHASGVNAHTRCSHKAF